VWLLLLFFFSRAKPCNFFSQFFFLACRTRTHAAVRAEYDQRRTEAKALEDTAARKRRRVDAARARLDAADSDLAEAVKRRDDLKSAESGLAAKRTELERLQGEITATTAELASLREAAAPLEEAVRVAARARDELQARHRATVRAARDACDACERDRDALDRAALAVREAALADTAGRKVTEESVQAARDSLQANIVEQDAARERIAAIQLQLAETQERERNMADNLAFRERQRAARELEAQAATHDDFAQDVRGLQQSLAKAKAALDESTAAMQFATGRSSRLHEERLKLEADLGRREYARVEQDVFELTLTLTTLKMAHADIARYKSGLDRAVAAYHSSKMDEINRILRELWQDTYAAGDIDYIEIRSNVETVAGRETQRYKVIMVKNGVELELRGRCSAGQKVLASLLIRLALAEAFCVKCGILALDEPTTNLDARNVELLAQALLNVINQRRRQANFQLLLITHDEEFVRLMARAGIVDKFYRVRKDPTTQFSQISREDFA
jgi:DNA repair protein RAD50